jgi:energy-coupling factor transporter transmembrane protein EcfT
MFDVLNLYSSLGTLSRALVQLFSRSWRKVEALVLSLMFRGEEANRLSSLIVAWVVVAAVTVLIALCVKRICFDGAAPSYLIEVRVDRQKDV